MQKHLFAATAALVGLFLSPAAHADSNGSVTIRNIQFQVFDLDPSDGVPATVTLEPITGRKSYTYAIANGQGGWGDMGTIPSWAHQSHLGANATVSLLGGASLDSFVLHAETDYGSGTSEAYAHGSLSIFFSLSKNAMLVLTADAATAAVTTLGRTATGEEKAMGRGYLNLIDSVSGKYLGPISMVHSGLHGPQAGSESNNGQLIATFQNTSGAPFSLTATFDLTADSGIYATPVPEPATYLMLLAGIGAISLLRRRRV